MVRNRNQQNMELQALLAEAHEFHSTDPHKSIAASAKSLELAIKIGDRQGEAQSHMYIGIAKIILGQFDAAVNILSHAISIFRELDNWLYLAKSFRHKGTAYLIPGKYLPAAQCFLECCSASQALETKDEYHLARLSLGQIHSVLQDHDKALKLTYESYQYFHATQNRKYLPLSLKNLASCYYNINEFKKALEFQNIANKLRDANPWHVSSDLLNLAIMYVKTGKPVKALKYFHKALDHNAKHGFDAQRASVYFNMGELHRKYLKNPDEALSAYTKALSIAEEHNNKRDEVYIRKGLGQLFIAKQQWGKAEEQLQKTLRLAESSIEPIVCSSATYLLATVYENRGDFDQGYRFLKEHIKYLEQLNDESKQRAITLSQIATYQAEQRRELTEKQLGELASRLRSQRTSLQNTASLPAIVQALQSVVDMKPERIRGELSSLIAKFEQENDAATNQGIGFLWQDLRASVADTIAQAITKKFPEVGLSPQEQKVCVLLRMGFTNEEIRTALDIPSVRTVETFKYRIKKKLKVEKGQNLSVVIMSVPLHGEY